MPGGGGQGAGAEDNTETQMNEKPSLGGERFLEKMWRLQLVSKVWKENVPGREDPTRKGMSMESENVLRQKNLVIVGPHRFKSTAIYLFL